MLDRLAPRERQIVDLLYVQGEATVAEVRESVPADLSSSAVRAMLTRLEAKGFVRRRQSERGYLFAPAVPENAAKHSALRQVVSTFFHGSPVGAASALLGMSDKLDEQELDELERLISNARKEQRK